MRLGYKFQIAYMIYKYMTLAIFRVNFCMIDRHLPTKLCIWDLGIAIFYATFHLPTIDIT